MSGLAAIADLTDIATPALLLDLDKAEGNLGRMAERAEELGVALRPHFKTHKCARLARLQVERSGAGGTVATLEEARYFAAHGFDDLTWAFPLILGRIDEVAELAGRIRLAVVIDSTAALDALESAGLGLPVWIKVDCGYHRAGVAPDGDLLPALANRLHHSPMLELAGLLSHSGHAYDSNGPEDARRIGHEERDVMVGCRQRLSAAGLPAIRLSVGSTPAMASVQDLSGIDEARPGNYIFFDYTQVQLGSCAISDCAVTVLASVVSSGSDHAIVDAGALALSKDAGPTDHRPVTYGEIFADYESSRLSAELRVVGLSQEHGRLSQRRGVGERLRILPNHSCLTVAHFDSFVVVRGETVVDHWPIDRSR